MFHAEKFPLAKCDRLSNGRCALAGKILRVGLAVTAFLPLTAMAAASSLTLADKWPAGDGACVDTPLRLTFSAPVHLGTAGKIQIFKAADHTLVDTLDLAVGNFTDTVGGKTYRTNPITFDGNTALIHPHAHVLQNGGQYLVTVDAATFVGADGQAFAGMAEAANWTFTTKMATASTPDHLTVAADGTGDFCTVQGAIDGNPTPITHPVTISIKPGVYDGLIRIGPQQGNISLVGADRKTTILTGLNNDKLNPSVSGRALIGVEGNNFTMKGLTVRNLTPHLGSQAEAVYIRADHAILQDDEFYSYQDTLCLNGSVYVTNCYIEGDVDFLWGYGAVFLDHCAVHAAHTGYFVQARNPVGKYGFIFWQCQLTCSDEVKKCWLARIAPDTFPASQVAFLNCSMGSGIPAEGWKLNAPKGVAEKEVVASPQLQFEEYRSVDPQGRPLDISHRLAGSKQLDDATAQALSDPAKVLAGTDAWNPLAAGGHL
jgi:pectin methylesterase-like acyl-CoA thioesterase